MTAPLGSFRGTRSPAQQVNVDSNSVAAAASATSGSSSVVDERIDAWTAPSSYFERVKNERKVYSLLPPETDVFSIQSVAAHINQVSYCVSAPAKRLLKDPPQILPASLMKCHIKGLEPATVSAEIDTLEKVAPGVVRPRLPRRAPLRPPPAR